MKEDAFISFGEDRIDPNVVGHITFNNYQQEITILDKFCMNPHCSCRDVILGFYEKAKIIDETKKLFEVVMDVDTGKVIRSTVFRQNIDCERMIKDFIKNIDKKTRLKIKKRVEDGKKYDGEIVKENISYSDIGENNFVFYTDIFNSREIAQSLFEYKGVQYCVLDSYCLNPNCHCNDVVLSFYGDLSPGETFSSLFSLKVKFATRNYQVLEQSNGITSQDIEDLYHSFLKHSNDKSLKCLKMRYRRMKKVSIDLGLYTARSDHSDHVSTESSNVRTIVTKEKIGRNTPCPCGSGKKYKKCCGR